MITTPISRTNVKNRPKHPLDNTRPFMELVDRAHSKRIASAARPGERKSRH